MDQKGVFEHKMLEVTKTLEKHVDAAIEKLDNLGVNELEELRKQRVKELKELQLKKQEWLQNGHGSYEQLAEEKMFFDVIKKSAKVVIHFFTPTNARSPIVDMHFKILAPKHIETRFVSINAEKCPFLTERLHVKTIPTLVCIRDTKIVDKIVGFTTLGNCDDFTTEVLEWRLAQNEAIDYEGDLSYPPNHGQAKPDKRSIRDGIYNNESDEDLELEDYSSSFKTSDNLKNQNFLTPEEAQELGLSDDEK